MRKCNACLVALLFIGAILLIFGILMVVWLIPKIVRGQVRKSIIISDTAESRAMWEDPSYNLAKQVWFFNVTNRNAVYFENALPKLQQIGPYGYRVKMVQKNVSFSENATIMSSATHKVFFWDQNLSCEKCSENDEITVPNALLFTLAKYFDLLPFFMKPKADAFLRYLRATPYVTAKVGDLLFLGYEDIILRMAAQPFVSALNLDIPTKLGFFYGKNNSNDGIYEVYTGVHEAERVGRVRNWRNMSQLPHDWWESAEALQIRGSTGSRYPPFLTPQSTPEIFISDICRSISFNFDSNFQWRGIPAARYRVSESAFDWSVNPGYCNSKAELNTRFDKTHKNAKCLPNGLLDVSRCKKGSPSIISLPHFLSAEKWVQDTFPELKPNIAEHGSFVDLEPMSGAPLNIQLKFQMNLATLHNDDISVLKNLKSAIVPVLWLNQSAVMDEKMRHYLYEKVVFTQHLIYALSYAAIGIGAVLVIASTVALFVVGTREARSDHMLPWPKPVDV